MRALGFVFAAIIAVVIVIALVTTAMSAQDIKRYLKMRQM